MPLQQFQILELNAIKKAICENVPNLMIIGGPNGVGKSTLLESLSRIFVGQKMGNTSANIQGTPKHVYIPPHRAPYPTSLSRSLMTMQPMSSFRDALGSDTYAVNDPMGQLSPILRTSMTRSRLYPDMATIFEVKNKIAQLEIRKNETIATAYEKNKQIPLDSIPDFYQPIRTMVEYLLPGVTFDEVRIEKDVYLVYFKNRLGELIEFDALSSGEKEILAMLFPIVEQQIESLIATVKGESPLTDDLVILIDSPESQLHPGLQYLFLKFIRTSIEKSKQQNQNLQFIISTHSSVIINEANKDELFLMTFQNQDENQLVRTSDFDLHKLQSYLGNLGLSAFTFGKPLLLLEGPDDENILRIINPDIEKLFVLYNLGGKERVASFIQALNQVIPELIKRGFRVYGIVDKDRDEIIKSCSELTQNNLFALPVVCMENLLLDSNYIFNALDFLARQKLSVLKINNAPDIENLKNSIINQSEFLDQELKTRLNEELSVYVNVDNVKPVNELNVNNRIDEIVTKRKERVAKTIQQQEKIIKDAISLKSFGQLNGKIILSMIGQKFGLKRQILARSIAKIMNEKKILPQELKDIFQSIQN